MNALSDFTAQHWVIGGAVTASLWLVAGKQSARNNPSSGLFWLFIGVFIALVHAAWCIRSKEWGGLALAATLIAFGCRELIRVYRLRSVGEVTS
jgi:hypothetical protein